MSTCNGPDGDRTVTALSTTLGRRSVAESLVYTSFGVILILTAFAKLFGVFLGPERALSQLDWVFQIEMRWVLLFAALLEAAIGAILLSHVRNNIKCVSGLAFFLWLGIYRVFGAWLGGPDPNGCGCLGYITDSLGIRHQSADKWLMVLLLLGLMSFSLQWMRYGLADEKGGKRG